MDSTILQVPIRKHVRDRAAKVARAQGFSSLQEAVRVFLNKFADEELRVDFTPPPVRPSKENDERYAQMIHDVQEGKVKPRMFANAKQLTAYLDTLS